MIIKYTRSNYINKYKEYHPLPSDDNFWTLHDFTINNQYHRAQFSKGFSLVINEIRLDLIKDVGVVLNEFGIKWFVFGKTLVSIYNNEDPLPYDHDDDIAVQGDKLLNNFSFIKKNLDRLGFSQIRHTEDIISFYRDSRYIDICLFSEVNSSYCTHLLRKYKTNILFPARLVIYQENKINLPHKPSKVIYKKYHSVINKIRSRAHNFKINRVLGSNRVTNLYIRVLIKSRHISRLLFNLCFGRVLRVRYRCIDLNTFLNLDIEEEKSFNRRWRKRHLDMITCGGKYWKLSQIYNYFGQSDIINMTQERVVEADLSEYIDIYKPSLSKKFWSSGNNFFFYCIKYGFVKNVVPYSNIGQYINKVRTPALYSDQYYFSLEKMRDEDVEIFLKIHPLEIENGSVVGGRHRALAIIGNLLKGSKINKIWVIERL